MPPSGSRPCVGRKGRMCLPSGPRAGGARRAELQQLRSRASKRHEAGLEPGCVCVCGVTMKELCPITQAAHIPARNEVGQTLSHMFCKSLTSYEAKNAAGEDKLSA